MHNVFFGGIAQYYDSAGTLVQDNNVPFVKTIARVTRNGTGTMAEYKLPVEMPGLMGAGAEFISLSSVPQYANEVIKLDSLTADTTLVGYIYGGISSTAANVFFTNTGAQSSASSQLFKVFVIKNSNVGVHQLNRQSISTFKMDVSPNPSDGYFTITFHLSKVAETSLSVYDIEGRKLEEYDLGNLVVGENTLHLKVNNLEYGGTYMVTLETPYEKETRKIIIER